MIFVRLIIFTILIPGTVALYIPRWLAQQFPVHGGFGLLRYVGAPLMLAGFLLYLGSALTFAIEGGGTPAIWFTKPLKYLIGEEPHKLVSGTLYRFSRNPMYIGVMTVVFGQALWLESSVLLIYTALLFICFHLVVVLIEEPHLRRKNGPSYEEYSRAVPRWVGFPRKRS